MIELESLRSIELREKLTEVILETLARLPETDRNIFIWNRYRGCSVRRIAERLGAGCFEIETALDAISSILLERTRGLLERHGVVESSFSEEVITNGGRTKTPGTRPCDRAPEAVLSGWRAE